MKKTKKLRLENIKPLNFKKNLMYQNKICVIGLGYVGLPLAVEFSKKFRVIGFDIDKKNKKFEKWQRLYK